MMPLISADKGVEHTIIKTGGNENTRKHLASLGFVQGAKVSVVNDLAGNLIINIKGSRVALDKKLAMKIFV